MNRRALIGLGTNLSFGGVGGPALLVQALEALGAAGLRPLALSSAWVSPAWPIGSKQPDYTNAVASVEAGAEPPEQVYAKLRAIEARFGRERRERWGPRTLDLDLLDLEGFIGEFGGLTLPHKHMPQRAFVLLPLAEVAPNWRHPVLGMDVAAMIGELGPADGVRRLGRFGDGPGVFRTCVGSSHCET